MTSEEIQKLQELKSLHCQAYEISRKIEMIMASLLHKKRPANKYDPDEFQKEIDRISNKKKSSHTQGCGLK